MVAIAAGYQHSLALVSNAVSTAIAMVCPTNLVLAADPGQCSRSNVTFVVAGSGPHLNELKALVSDSNLNEKVKFVGHMETDALCAFYKSADLTVVPSLYEPFGMVVLESMAMSTPTIVADTGGLSEIVVHEETGLKFEPGNAESLAEAMLRILQDEGLSEKLTSDAMAYMGDQYNWDRIARRTIEVYRRAERNYDYHPRTLKLCPPLPHKAAG